MVEARGVEPLSENSSAGLSTSVASCSFSPYKTHLAKLYKEHAEIRYRVTAIARLTFTANRRLFPNRGIFGRDGRL